MAMTEMIRKNGLIVAFGIDFEQVNAINAVFGYDACQSPHWHSALDYQPGIQVAIFETP